MRKAMTEYKKGQRVKVELEAEILGIAPEMLYVRRPGGTLWVSLKDATVTPLDPPDWPPQVGDIWEAEGREWFARSAGRANGQLRVLVGPDDSLSLYELPEFKALNPVLVRRRGQ